MVVNSEHTRRFAKNRLPFHLAALIFSPELSDESAESKKSGVD
jgi:hypothetical protein